MPVVSIRFGDPSNHERLKAAAARRREPLSTLAERLIDEGLRMAEHPLVVFRDGHAGRRAALAGGPDVAEVVGGIVGGDVPVAERRQRAVELLDLTPSQVDAALAYYAEFTDEVDAEVAEQADVAERERELWARQRQLLER